MSFSGENVLNLMRTGGAQQKDCIVSAGKSHRTEEYHEFDFTDDSNDVIIDRCQISEDGRKENGKKSLS